MIEPHTRLMRPVIVINGRSYCTSSSVDDVIYEFGKWNNRRPTIKELIKDLKHHRSNCEGETHKYVLRWAKQYDRAIKRLEKEKDKTTFVG